MLLLQIRPTPAPSVLVNPRSTPPANPPTVALVTLLNRSPPATRLLTVLPASASGLAATTTPWRMIVAPL